MSKKDKAGNKSKKEGKNANLNKGDILFISIIIIVVALGLFAYYFYGFSLVVVDGISMKPTLHTGDIAILYKEPYQDIKVGNIVVYNYYGTLIIHRVIGIYNHDGMECFIIKGDNNPIPDPGFPQCGYYTVDGFTTQGVPYYEIKGVILTYNGTVPIVIPYIGSFALAIRGTGSDTF